MYTSLILLLGVNKILLFQLCENCQQFITFQIQRKLSLSQNPYFFTLSKNEYLLLKQIETMDNVKVIRKGFLDFGLLSYMV